MNFTERLEVESAQLEAMNEGFFSSFAAVLGSLVFGAKKLSDTDTTITFNVDSKEDAEEAAQIIEYLGRKYGGEIVEKPQIKSNKVVFPRISFADPSGMQKFQKAING